ncbi:uncharacterized protein LOC128241036 isoform X2 [Mya arenaria]|uniref:uncharacterized protein LOC128241036 isoform X2 n=1 Tax=Mya arenaria TaxID=6604 RepID=UPI0022E76E46|nr:uncharacterized protein LOC128241036 isoform X2 [Mya arenaria]XP_052814001.1 uncharacterized protein LOC128241036 isoform X2 [Mya arenaria]
MQNVENTNPKLRLDIDVVSLSADKPSRQSKHSDTGLKVVPASPEINDPIGDRLTERTRESKCFLGDLGELQGKGTADTQPLRHELCTDMQGETGKNETFFVDEKMSVIYSRVRDISASFGDKIKIIEKNPHAVDVVDIHGPKYQQFIDVSGRRQRNENLAVAEQFPDLPTPPVVTDGLFIKPREEDPVQNGWLQEKAPCETFTELLEDEGSFCSIQNETAKESKLEEEELEIGAKLGKGGQGIVLLGKLPETGKLVAIKHVRITKGVEALRREYEIAMILNGHPNIIEVYKAEKKDGHFLTYMEYMKDGAVNKHRWYGEGKEEEGVKHVLREVLKGLRHIHDSGIIHRDIKGDNVLKSGDDIKIADLGSAVCAPRIGNGYGDVVDNTFQGTLHFISKEVVREQRFSTASDIWAVGCLGIELVTGELPWGACKVGDSAALLFKIGNTDTPPPLPPDISESLRNFLNQCLQIDPRDRPSASQLLQDKIFADVEE